MSNNSNNYKIKVIPLLLAGIVLIFFHTGCRFLGLSDETGPDLASLPPVIEGISFYPNLFEPIEIEYDISEYTGEEINELRYYFASKIVYFLQAPGQFANNGEFGMAFSARKALGPPIGGGTYAPYNGSIVSLGMGGGEIVLEFEEPIINEDDTVNYKGYDFIVFGNAFWSNGNPDSHWQEPGIVWVGVPGKDDEGHEINDFNSEKTKWYIIPGSLASKIKKHEETYHAHDDEFKPSQKSWYPKPDIYEDYPDHMTREFFLIPSKYGGNDSHEIYGYCDVTPTLLLGDMSGAGNRKKGGSNTNDLNDAEDDADMKPWDFYTIPNNNDVTPGNLGVDPGSGGGDAIDIDWARDPKDLNTPVNIREIRWIKIVCGCVKQEGACGEVSTEVDAVARVRKMADYNPKYNYSH